MVQEAIDENKRKRFFKRLFPSVDYLYYKQFFTEDRYLNQILDDRLTAKKRDNSHMSRIMNQKMPIFLQANGQSTLQSLNTIQKIGAAPPSGLDRHSNIC